MAKKHVMKIIKNFIKAVEEHNIKIEVAFLFGSYAQNKANKDSDIDIVGIFRNNRDNSKDVLNYLKEYVLTESVDCFVVGLPRQMNNTDSESARFIEPFVKLLQKEFPAIHIARMDERFTSKMASAAILEAGLKKKDRQNKALVDTVSATIILQSYLEMRAGGFI